MIMYAQNARVSSKQRVNDAQNGASVPALPVTVVARASRPGDVQHTTLGAVLERFRRPSEHLQALISRIRNARSKEERDALKRELAQVVFAGIFERRQNDGIRSYSGILTVDLDADQNPGCDLPGLKSLLAQDPYVLAAFISPSGNGLKLLVRVAEPIAEVTDPVPLQKAHARASRAFFGYLRATYGLIADDTPDLSRACFATVDPALHFNPDAEIFRFRHEVELPPVASSGDGAADLELIESALAALPLDGSLDYHLWLKVLFALTSAVGEDAAVELMLKHTRDARDTEEYIRQRLKSYRGEVQLGTLFWLAGQYGWCPPRKQREQVRAGDGQLEQQGTSEKKRKSQADELVEIALELAELWHTPDGEAWATIQVEGHREHHQINTRGFHEWLGRELFKRRRKTPSAQAVQDALLVIAGEAKFSGGRYEVHTRVAATGDAIYLDMSDPYWRAIEITAGGWRIIETPPVRFRRAPGALPLPEPERGGEIGLLWRYVNVAEEDRVLVLAWLLMCLHPTGPYPVLAVGGEGGRGKSTSVEALRKIVDPNSAPLRTPPKSEWDLVVATKNSLIVAFDNVGGIQPWLSDALCRISTGAGFSVRRLYTTDEEHIIEFCRPVALTSVTDVVTASDLLDRSIVIVPPRLEQQIPEDELWQQFEKDRPKILGALLDLVVRALQRRDQQPPVQARMADFTAWGYAALGEPFLERYLRNRAEAQAIVLEAEPVSPAIIDFVRAVKIWRGACGELLEQISRDKGPEELKALERQGWPRSARGMAARLRKLGPVLAANGIEIEELPRGPRGERYYQLKLLEEDKATIVRSSDRQIGAENRANSLKNEGFVSDDLSDDFDNRQSNRQKEIGDFERNKQVSGGSDDLTISPLLFSKDSKGEEDSPEWNGVQSSDRQAGEGWIRLFPDDGGEADDQPGAWFDPFEDEPEPAAEARPTTPPDDLEALRRRVLELAEAAGWPSLWLNGFGATHGLPKMWQAAVERLSPEQLRAALEMIEKVLSDGAPF